MTQDPCRTKKNPDPRCNKPSEPYNSPKNSKGTAVVDESESFRNSTPWNINMKDNHRGLQFCKIIFLFKLGNFVRSMLIFRVYLVYLTWAKGMSFSKTHTHLVFQADNLKQHQTLKNQMLCQPPRPKKETWPSWISLDHPKKHVLKKTTGSFKITLSALDI